METSTGTNCPCGRGVLALDLSQSAPIGVATLCHSGAVPTDAYFYAWESWAWGA